MAVSSRAKKNRLFEPARPGTRVVLHQEGSRSAISYARAFVAVRGVTVNDVMLETFERLHKIEGTWSDAKSGFLGAEIDRIAVELSQSLADGTPAPDKRSLWMLRNGVYLA